MNMKRAYYYLFYKLYKFWEAVSIPRVLERLESGILY
ncbi:hypothetical protein SRABI126_03597 [Pedobacter sp. Bi126]|nr:hypothetical protein SRABI126_03597 [Pedobacter sp. Bi126]